MIQRRGSQRTGVFDCHGVRGALRTGGARSPAAEPRSAAATGGGPEQMGEGWLVSDHAFYHSVLRKGLPPK